MVGNGNIPEWVTLQLRLRRLIKETSRKYQEAYPAPLAGMTEGDSHGAANMDACTILLPYVAFARLTGDAEMRDWLYTWRDAYVDVMRNDRADFYHGFPVEGEAHHQWEDQSRFLGRLWFLDGSEPLHSYVVDDAAEHVLNAVPGVPAWYDWEKHDLLSYWFGTKRVAYRDGWEGAIWGTDTATPPTGIYREALYRVAQVGLNAYYATGSSRYLDWAKDFLGGYIGRLDAMGAQEDLVRVFATEGWPLPQHTDYFHKNGWPKPGNRFVYGRYVPALLTDLYSITGETQYADTARRFIDFCFPGILEYWHQRFFFGQMMRYRLVTGDTRYDASLMEAIEAECGGYPLGGGDFDPKGYPWHENGVAALGYARLRGPLAHSLQYEITGDERYAVKALRQACEMADVLMTRDSREFVEDFATPHIGGIVDSILVNPLLNLSCWRPGLQAHNIDVMDIIVQDQNGNEGLPADIALLRTPAPLTHRRLTLVNTGKTEQTVRVGAGDLRPIGLAEVRVNGMEVNLDGGDQPAGSGELRTPAITLTLPPGVPVAVEMTVSQE